MGYMKILLHKGNKKGTIWSFFSPNPRQQRTLRVYRKKWKMSSSKNVTNESTSGIINLINGQRAKEVACTVQHVYYLQYI
jgi:hypothetical protein